LRSLASDYPQQRVRGEIAAVRAADEEGAQVRIPRPSFEGFLVRRLQAIRQRDGFGATALAAIEQLKADLSPEKTVEEQRPTRVRDHD
jgi:hypothetical protein